MTSTLSDDSTTDLLVYIALKAICMTQSNNMKELSAC